MTPYQKSLLKLITIFFTIVIFVLYIGYVCSGKA
jgi:hypothetical protein